MSEDIASYGTTRALSVRTTWDRAWAKHEHVGVTRMAEVTALDRVGVPVWQAIRPRSRNLSVSQGKGMSNLQARLSALLEAYELFAAEEPPVDRRATIDAIESELGYDPEALPRRLGPLPRDVSLEWSEARTLLDGRRTWVPTALLRLDFTLSRLGPPLFAAVSNGLASGSTWTDACLHGLYELLERDALHEPSYGLVALASLRDDVVLAPLLERIATAGLDLELRVRRTRLALDCFEARVADEDAATLFVGTAVNTSPRRAMAAAVLEALQSRLTHITGSRDDIHAEDYLGRPPSPSNNESPDSTRGTELPRVEIVADPARELGVTAELESLSLALFERGLEPFAVDLGRALELPIAFVVCPGLRGPC